MLRPDACVESPLVFLLNSPRDSSVSGQPFPFPWRFPPFFPLRGQKHGRKPQRVPAIRHSPHFRLLPCSPPCTLFLISVPPPRPLFRITFFEGLLAGCRLGHVDLLFPPFLRPPRPFPPGLPEFRSLIFKSVFPIPPVFPSRIG